MAEPDDLSPTIIEALYCEALELADEARSAFDLSGQSVMPGDDDDLARIALSCEALRTTTRMMHAIAWLLNHRAYFAGDLTQLQLRRQGPLPPAPIESDPLHISALEPDQRELVARTARFYARIERIDEAWRGHLATQPEPIHRLRERLALAVQALRPVPSTGI